MNSFFRRFFDPLGLSRRDNRSELMDDPSCDTQRLIRTVGQFEIINMLFTRSHYLATRYLIPQGVNARTRSLSVLDIGAGGGDFARGLSRWAERHGTHLEITCIDIDPRIVDFAREQCNGYSNITIEQGDIWSPELAKRRFDCVFANHFLHHIPDQSIPDVLSLLNSLAKEKLLINDTRRSQLAYTGYAIFSRLFLHNSFAAYDGLLSIRKGFSKRELTDHIAHAGLSNSLKVRTFFPGRVIVYK
ncbi:MAG: methyltransferase domain-containing protein [Fibrobacter sp.]|nr:methyltransferase domain-containing protein [Fibrobacter sp.]